MKPIKDLVATIVETEIATLTPIRDQKPEPKSKEIPQLTEPSRTPWQQKWIRLEIHHPHLQAAADQAELWAQRVLKCDRHKSGLVLCGVTGTGKTHIAKALDAWVRHVSVRACLRGGGVWDNALRSFYVAWPEASDAIREKKVGFMEDCFKADVLVLDDVGAERDPFQEATDKLCQILSRRETRFTVVTTNVQPEKWAEKFDFRISDRFLRNSVVVDLGQVESYTLKV